MSGACAFRCENQEIKTTHANENKTTAAAIVVANVLAPGTIIYCGIVRYCLALISWISWQGALVRLVEPRARDIWHINCANKQYIIAHTPLVQQQRSTPSTSMMPIRDGEIQLIWFDK